MLSIDLNYETAGLNYDISRKSFKELLQITLTAQYSLAVPILCIMRIPVRPNSPRQNKGPVVEHTDWPRCTARGVSKNGLVSILLSVRDSGYCIGCKKMHVQKMVSSLSGLINPPPPNLVPARVFQLNCILALGTVILRSWFCPLTVSFTASNGENSRRLKRVKTPASASC